MAAVAQPCGQVAWNNMAQLDGQRDAAGGSDPFFAQRGTAVLLATSGTQANTTWRLMPMNMGLTPGPGWGWVKQSTGGIASGRSRAGMVAAPWRDKMVLFGGRDLTGVSFNQLWELADASWIRISDPPPTPPPLPVVRDWPAVATVGNAMVLFGGLSGTTRLGDTWVWDGATWTRLSAGGEAGVPTPRFGAAFAFDPVAEAAVLFGGTGSGSTLLGDTWEFKNNAWSVRTGGTPPPPMSHPRMAFDPALKRTGISGEGGLVLFGGQPASGGPSNRTWTRLGGEWREAVVVGPDARSSHTMISIGSTQMGSAVALFGGVGASGSLLADTWTWSEGVWTQIALLPTPRDGTTLATDPDRGRVLMFGGAESTGAATDRSIYEWTGAAWRLASASLQVSASTQHTLTGVPKLGVVLAGGLADGIPLANSTAFDGTRWQSLAPMPRARFAHAAACFETTEELVIHGGLTPAASPETLVFDGGSWRTLAGGGPGTRAGHAMAYDRIRNRIVLFGGSDGSTLLGDTWTFDGTAWSVAATSGPSPRSGHILTYDAARGRVVLYGGINSSGTRLGDVWEWNGATWAVAAISNPAAAPAARSALGGAFDPMTERVLLFGGHSLARSNETITLGGRQTPSIVDSTSGSLIACYRQSFSLEVRALGGGLSYQWQRGGVPLVDGKTPWGTTMTGARTSRLWIARLAAEDAGTFVCVVSNSCGQVTSPTNEIRVCEADADCDGFISADDFEAYVAGFDGNSPIDPDFDGDGFVDGFDYDAFVAAFERGCG